VSPFIHDGERAPLEALAALADLNPFLLEERTELELRALGSSEVEPEHVRRLLLERASALAESLQARLAAGARAARRDLALYEGLVRYVLFERYQRVFTELIQRADRGQSATGRVSEYARYRSDVAHFLEIPEVELPGACTPAHLFAWGFQIRRAYSYTFRQIYGASKPAARLRATVWQSIFTHDTDRYRRALYGRMGDITTLILGESGTGKELVARAIGLSRYVPFDEKSSSFAADCAASFHPVNLSALSANLIESELFGHRRGAFTGAFADHAGWLETCIDCGSVFLDEIAELDPQLQVKLLRVLQSRRFQRVGETREREFTGKIIAATNRDLVEERSAGRFRSDLYYRLCADVIRTPTLREQLADAPEDLGHLVEILCVRIVGENEAFALRREVLSWIEKDLGPSYTWPGNVRELEQCVRNVLVRGAYHPEPMCGPDDLGSQLERGELSAEELLRRYCTIVYARTGSYEEAARRLGLDRRTVKAKVDLELLERMRS
jgi:transcriptional regulator of acetoin/glycerol metabolism